MEHQKNKSVSIKGTIGLMGFSFVAGILTYAYLDKRDRAIKNKRVERYKSEAKEAYRCGFSDGHEDGYMSAILEN